eukprot:Opistho-1_new@43796
MSAQSERGAPTRTSPTRRPSSACVSRAGSVDDTHALCAAQSREREMPAYGEGIFPRPPTCGYSPPLSSGRESQFGSERDVSVLTDDLDGNYRGVPTPSSLAGSTSSIASRRRSSTSSTASGPTAIVNHSSRSVMRVRSFSAAQTEWRPDDMPVPPPRRPEPFPGDDSAGLSGLRSMRQFSIVPSIPKDSERDDWTPTANDNEERDPFSAAVASCISPDSSRRPSRQPPSPLRGIQRAIASSRSASAPSSPPMCGLRGRSTSPLSPSPFGSKESGEGDGVFFASPPRGGGRSSGGTPPDDFHLAPHRRDSLPRPRSRTAGDGTNFESDPFFADVATGRSRAGSRDSQLSPPSGSIDGLESPELPAMDAEHPPAAGAGGHRKLSRSSTDPLQMAQRKAGRRNSLESTVAAIKQQMASSLGLGPRPPRPPEHASSVVNASPKRHTALETVVDHPQRLATHGSLYGAKQNDPLLGDSDVPAATPRNSPLFVRRNLPGGPPPHAGSY